jgi:hypothetical protein
VADTYAHDIKVFDDAGALLHVIGRRGSADGEFNFPTHLAWAQGELYVTDTLNNRIQVLGAEGQVLQRKFGERGLQLGQLVRPKGVSVDGEGNVYVVESYYDSLLVFSPRGEFLLPDRRHRHRHRTLLPARRRVGRRAQPRARGRHVQWPRRAVPVPGWRLMSARLLLLFGLAVLAGWLPAPLADAQRVSDVRNTRHNLSTNGPGTTHASGLGTSEVCVFCHTPHNATQADQGNNTMRAPLWNRRVPDGATYTPYTSSSMDAQSIPTASTTSPAAAPSCACRATTARWRSATSTCSTAMPTSASR